jgi:two-component system, cell cycle sensor histidine kinase and response regulator CckA
MSTIRVLLVEHDENDANLTCAMLRDSREPHFEIECVRSAEDALSRMADPNSLYDVFIFEDPRAGRGLDLVVAAQEAERREPILVLTRQGAPNIDEEAMRAGAADYLVKEELTAQQLQRAIRHAVLRAAKARAYLEGEERMIQAQRMESLGRLAGSVAHDFNNLLTGIIGYTSILEREVATEHAGRRPVEEIRKAAELAASLTRQLLAYSRKQSKRLAVVDVNDVLEGLSHMLARLIGEHLTFDIERGTHLPNVLVDQGQLEQVILNLVLNARDATGPAGRIMLSTGSTELPDEEAHQENLARGGRYATITIQDTGEGMSSDALEHLFQPFFTTKPVGKGTGLGLASSNRIVRQAGGFIRVHSVLGQGTTVTVFLPESNSVRARPELTAAPPSAETSGTETVLVIEDDETVRNFVQDALTFYGYRPLMASEPSVALRIARETHDRIDAALTDIVLPDMSGMHLAQHLIDLRPGLRVLYMSGYLDARGSHSALPPDAAFLRKPFQPDDLARLLRQVLDRNNTARTARA